MTDLDPAAQHKFWNTQPIVQENEKPKDVHVIDKESTVETTQKEPYKLVPGFEWSIIDTQDPEQKAELFDFLAKHYVMHPKNAFRFAYSPEFLDWALHPPGWKQQWHLGVRMSKTNRLVAFISAVPISIFVAEKEGDPDDQTHHIVAVDFLSVHQSLRGKNLAPLLIKEITRRVNLEGIFTAIFTAGRKITEPFTYAQYYHRLINYQKLLEINFTSLRRGSTLAKEIAAHKLAAPKIDGFRPMVAEDVPQVTVKLNQYLRDNRRFSVSQVFSEAEVAHMFIPRKDIVGSYVIEKDGEVTAFFSFYVVPSTVADNPKHSEYTAAYIYYYFAKKTVLSELTRAAMYMANTEYNVDVMNCLNIIDNQELFNVCKFVPGDGHLHYYFFNLALPQVKPERCGVVLL